MREFYYRHFLLLVTESNTRGTIYILRLGNIECSQVPSEIRTGKFDNFDHNHL